MSVTMRFDQKPKSGSCHEARHARPNFGSASLETRIRAAVRRCIAEEIERLMLVLDGLDVDADFEDAGEAEPSLGWTQFNGGLGWLNNGQSSDDREDDAGDDCEPDEDREPILGWTEDENQANVHRMADPWRWAD